MCSNGSSANTPTRHPKNQSSTNGCFTRQAELDLEEIGDTIAADNPSIALRFICVIRGHCKRIAAAPRAYIARPELGTNIHCCVHQRCLILFQTSATEALIVRVLHGSRDLMSLFADN